MNLWDRVKRSLFEGGLKHSLSTLGLANTFKYTWHNFYFDMKYGTDTTDLIKSQKLKTTSAHRVLTDGYSATNYLLLRRIFTRLDIPYHDSVLLDFGCGKGRVLLVGIQYGFSKVIGIDFSEELCEMCRSNIEHYKERHGLGHTRVQIIPEEATEYKIPPETNVFFFYNPFSEEVMERVIGNIEESLRVHPRKIFIIYVNPVDRELFERRGFSAIMSVDNSALILTKDTGNVTLP